MKLKQLAGLVAYAGLIAATVLTDSPVVDGVFWLATLALVGTIFWRERRDRDPDPP